jgi:hypothetical protein
VSPDRFTNLAIPSIENEVASSIDFNDVVKDFAGKFNFQFFTSVIMRIDLSPDERNDCDFLNAEFLLGAAIVITRPGRQKT